MNGSTLRQIRLLLGMLAWAGGPAGAWAADDLLAWPAVTAEARPHSYWWWMGSAVDTNNIARELRRYQEAGLGGVHIIPIYGAKGWESSYIPYLSPKWMEMLDFTVREADRLGLQVDMTTGTGWCFGGPQVTDEEANAVLVSRHWQLGTGERMSQKLEPAEPQALMAFGPDGNKVDLRGRVSADGSVDWTAPEGDWTVFAVWQKPSGQRVKRAAPGGEGWMLNPAYPPAMTHYLEWFDQAFNRYSGARPRAQYHDSYEYKMDWSPALFAEFEKRRGYRLQDELNTFLTGEPAERAARVKCDYRETISDIIVEETFPLWVNWSHHNGFITRNEAHGSPANWLDFYAVADIPETEMFRDDRNKLISKFASSAAHVTGGRWVSAETGTWLAEHFTETLADMKYLLDDLFLSGVNHVFYHGTCYSPDEVPWPGWVFYASYEMNPRNSIWRDVGALNAYATRCQSVLQSGQPDNDILLYWPLHDFWSRPDGMTRNLTVHARDWFEDQPIGETAAILWNAGYAFDYVSDRQLAKATVKDGRIEMGGAGYRVIIVPECHFMPLATLNQILSLARAGATVVFEDHLPEDVPGLGDLEQRRQQFKSALGQLRFETSALGVPIATTGEGHVLIGAPADRWTAHLPVRAEVMAARGLSCVRRSFDGGWHYFIANRGRRDFDAWVELGRDAQSAVILDPMTGHSGVAALRHSGSSPSVRLQLPAGGSLILRAFADRAVTGTPWIDWRTSAPPAVVTGPWRVRFLQGGPAIPGSFETRELSSWTELGDTNAVRFAGTARYRLRFDAPEAGTRAGLQAYRLELGRVCQSARVRLNGQELGTLFTPPFRVVVDQLKPTDNVLEVDVTNTSANRIRDLDQRAVKWQNFHDINFVNQNYKKFDASAWPVADSGLLGPVTLTPVKPRGGQGTAE